LLIPRFHPYLASPVKGEEMEKERLDSRFRENDGEKNPLLLPLYKGNDVFTTFNHYPFRCKLESS